MSKPSKPANLVDDGFARSIEFDAQRLLGGVTGKRAIM
jgi:hypothetical protein